MLIFCVARRQVLEQQWRENNTKKQVLSQPKPQLQQSQQTVSAPAGQADEEEEEEEDFEEYLIKLKAVLDKEAEERRRRDEEVQLK